MIPIVLPFKSQVLINPLENDGVQSSPMELNIYPTLKKYLSPWLETDCAVSYSQRHTFSIASVSSQKKKKKGPRKKLMYNHEFGNKFND